MSKQQHVSSWMQINSPHHNYRLHGAIKGLVGPFSSSTLEFTVLPLK